MAVQQQYPTGAPDYLSTKLELSIWCASLKNLDVGSKSDPMTIVYLKQNGNWVEAGRTELIKNNLNPKFATPVAITYFFEETQPIKFVVIDVDDPKHHVDANSKGKETIGYFETTVGEIVSAKSSTVFKDLRHDHHNHNGTIFVKANEIGANNLNVKFRIFGSHLDKKDFFSKSDPFLKISKSNGDGMSETLIYKSEVINDTLDPVWKEFEMPLGRLCNGNVNLPLHFECFDYDSDTKFELIGEFKTTYAEIAQKKSFELIEPHIKSKKGDKYKNSGVLNITVTETRIYSFFDYLAGGTGISLMCGVDFTGSNGDPSLASSLHYINPNGGWNEYMSAIRVIGDVVAPYDADRYIPSYGFGGILQGGTSANHCFALNGNEQNPNCPGVDGVLNAYQNAIRVVKLSGPTNFAPIINRVADFAATVDGGESYYILLMITDGEISDMKATLQAISRATTLPMSIIIVGVGSADFGKMNALDDDEGALGFKRDIVQFVPYRKYSGVVGAQLAKDTLAEVPKQLLQYMNMRNIKPRTPPVFVQPPVQVVQQPQVQPTTATATPLVQL